MFAVEALTEKCCQEKSRQHRKPICALCTGKREVWTDYEEAKAYLLEFMMSTDGEKLDRAECVYIQLIHGLDERSDEDEQIKERTAIIKQSAFVCQDMDQ